MKKILTTLAFSLLISSFAQADSLGLADSQDRYSITRNSIDIPTAPASMATVESGDRVRSTNAPVKVETTSGNMLMVGEQSDATILSDNAAQLHRGVIVMTVPVTEKEASLSSAGLSVFAIEQEGATAEATADNAGLVAMRKVSDDEIIIGADRRPFAVKDEVTGDQIAMVGPGDSMRFIKTQKGWNVLPFGTKKSDGGTDTIVSAQSNDSSDSSADRGTDNDSPSETKRRRALPLILLGVGGAAVAGGLGYAGYEIYDNNRDDDDDDDDDDNGSSRDNGGDNDDDNNDDDEGSRGESSPIIPHLPPGHHIPHGHHLPIHYVPVHHPPHHAAPHHGVSHHPVTHHEAPTEPESSS